MGCNTWGGLGPFVNEKGVRASAEAMISIGLINHGYCYVNIDDSWQGKRRGGYNAIQPNEKFNNMGKLCDAFCQIPYPWHAPGGSDYGYAACSEE